ncbi:centromere-associated protein E-like isoform X2 [Plodia interpunctella]|uniref:centromere-associated protein E-like isoform X2 n=1 Tax=Plodia interpunctella TaxID=58824 RepID=UPI002368F287|nr:centromere-associated protein E-like isoform X2 [Plodia interpunctella]
MSFITKRERVFNDYDLFDLPARNEGKLKAYASCTDARAWSHFCSDKTEHLVDIIKRNNDTCRPKYVPTDVIVDTLMVAKNAEIGRLKRKIGEFEEMLTAYDQLDLTCEQKCEIATAHAAIKAANKELDDMFLDLDLSGFTEGIESDAFETGKSRGDETGKSRGDEWVVAKEPPPIAQHKSNQAAPSPCDACTFVTDPRIQQMKDALINKDAKLSAMQNTIAVMENDVCEPYCIYAHIYTALEKIFGILCQNDKYKLYLSLMTAGKDTRCIDIKGKILYKLKVLEKFCQALIAPCSQPQERDTGTSEQDCSCYRAEILKDVIPSPVYALTSAEIQSPILDTKRAHLVADIMENEEMKEILRKESLSNVNQGDETEDFIDDYDIETENLKRLKNLQEDYDDLMTCYEALKHEKEDLLLKCQKYEELDKEYVSLRNQLREYNLLWNEKEHYRKRSTDLDSLKEQFLILSEETSSMETQLKAESEINKMKANTIEELRNENIALEKKLNDALIAFEKEKSIALCKLQETECKCMCQEQQIKSLSVQIDRLLEQEPEKAQTHGDPAQTLMLIDEVESLKEQIKNLKDTLLCCEEEKQNLHDEFQDNLKLINDLRMEIEDWRSTYEKAIHRNNYLEEYAHHYEDDINRLVNENKRLVNDNNQLSQDVKDKAAAVDNLINVINDKSQEINKLLGDADIKENENKDLLRRLQDMYESNVSDIENDKKEALESLSIAKRESEELLHKLKDYEDVIQSQNDMSKGLAAQIDNYNQIKQALLETIAENKNLQMDLVNREKNNTHLRQEIQKLQEAHTHAIDNIDGLNEEKNKYKTSLELTSKKSETLSQDLQSLQETYENLTADKRNLEKELRETKYKLEDAKYSADLSRTESKEFKVKSENLADELSRLNHAYQMLLKEKNCLYKELSEKNLDLISLQKSLDDLKATNENLEQKCNQISNLEDIIGDLQKACDKLDSEKQLLQNDLDTKNEEINNLCNNLESKIDENSHLLDDLMSLQNKHKAVRNDLDDLSHENLSNKMSLDAVRKESDDLSRKLKYYENLEKDFIKLRQDNYQIKLEKQKLQDELNSQFDNLRQAQQENNELQKENLTLIRHTEHLEKGLVDARTQLAENMEFEDPYLEIKNEIEVLNREKDTNLQRIRDLSNELDILENVVTNLTQDVSARDDKIAVLENHINKLKDEITRLHGCLSVAIEAGEQLKSTSYEKIGQSLENMEAHHSKATHNMKIEIANLQNEKMKLEAQMSFTKLKTEESVKEYNKNQSLLAQLQNEREIIVTDIKQLELQSVGDSSLSPINCSVENILESLDRIRKILEVKTAKNNSLEQALFKVQRSSQVLVSEAKDLVEKEKQKILNEKEDAIRDKQYLQKQLEDQKLILETQIENDKQVIKDLEAEVLNQKLIISKINESTASYISKLEEEMQSIQTLYENSMAKISELQEKLQNITEESNHNLEVIDKLQQDLKQKSCDISSLQRELEMLQNKDTQNSYTQTEIVEIKSETSHLTETKLLIDKSLRNRDPIAVSNKSDPTRLKASEENNMLSILPKQRPHSINEVQILTANVEPTFDFVKSSYLNYKLKQLSIGRIEQQSISNDEISIHEDVAQYSGSASNNTDKVQTKDNDIVDLYNRKSLHTDSSKAEYRDPETSNSKTDYKETSLFAESDQTKDSKETPNIKKKNDKDLFVIYKESETDFENKLHDDQGSWNTNKKSGVKMGITISSPPKEEVRKQKTKNDKIKNEQMNKYLSQDINYNEYKDDVEDDDSVKPKLNIKLPRVATDSPSNQTSEGDRKSLDSYRMTVYLSPKETHSDNKLRSHRKLEKTISQETPSLPALSNDEKFTNSNISFRVPVYEKINKEKYKKQRKDELMGQKNNEKSSPLENKSVHKLSRVGADAFLIKTKDNNQGCPRNMDKDYGLQYILDAINKENESELPESYSFITDKTIQKSKNNATFNPPVKMFDSSSPTKTNDSIWSPSKISEKTVSRSVMDRGIMVKLDIREDYEEKVRFLTKALENVEKDYKKKIDAIKIQYDSNIKSIINEHNSGVNSIQNLHEETLQDIIKIHENEVENLRTLSIEAMRKTEQLEKENRTLKSKIPDYSPTFDEPTRICCNEGRKKRRSRTDTYMLTKTNVEAFNVKPKVKSHGPCTCSLDINLSDTIRNIFEQVDIDQRKMAEHTYMKYIAKKILSNTVEALDAQELSFLHLKVCRTWKSKLSKEEALQKKIDTLEHELMNKQRNAQQHIAELDRKVAEERRRLQEVREAVCRSPPDSRCCSPTHEGQRFLDPVPPAPPPTATEKDLLCGCNTGDLKINERRSAGDITEYPTKPRRVKESNRAVLARLDAEERRERRLYHDEPPTRLRRGHPADRYRSHKK